MTRTDADVMMALMVIQSTSHLERVIFKKIRESKFEGHMGHAWRALSAPTHLEWA